MQTVYRVYEGTRAPHRLAVERAAEVLGCGGLALTPTETVYGVAVAVNAFSDAVPQDTGEFPSRLRDPPPGWSMASKHSTAMAWISRKRPACLPDDAGRAP